MIASLLAWIAASPWARAALRYGVLALTVLLFLLSIRRKHPTEAARLSRARVAARGYDGFWFRLRLVALR